MSQIAGELFAIVSVRCVTADRKRRVNRTFLKKIEQMRNQRHIALITHFVGD
jgi:hypothetical protein